VTVNLRHLRIAVVLALPASLAACAPQLTPDQFVGTWKSSRSTEPLTLHANGDWEIRDGDDRTLQYGVWQLRGRTFIWSIRLDRQLQHDPNAIVAVQEGSFELREGNGTLTRFRRIK
jgi:hypothetical protein